MSDVIYARVICDGPERHVCYLTEEEYNQQMSNPDALWKCKCGDSAQFDDDYFEESHPGLYSGGE